MSSKKQTVPKRPAIPTQRTDASDKIAALTAKVEELQHSDGWANVIVGLGKAQDKRLQTKIENIQLLTDDELDAIYAVDGLGATIVNVVADDMTREWLDLSPDTNEDDEMDEEAKEQLIELSETLGIQAAFNEALKWTRLYGGALIILGAQDGQDLEQPYVPKKIGAGPLAKVMNALGLTSSTGLGGLVVVDRRRVKLGTSLFQTDITKPNYGQVEKFDVEFYAGNQSQMQKVHASRCLIFKGVKMPIGARNIINIDQRYWGFSALQQPYTKIRDLNGILGSVGNLMYEFTIGKYTISNLVEMLAQGKDEDVVNRMEIINMTKSVINAVLLGEGENYTRDTVPLGGIPEILQTFMAIVSGVTGIPTHKLFSQMRAGLNADGGVEENYYDGLRALQMTQIKPPLKRLYSIIETVYGIKCPPIKFASLYRPDPKTEAETEKLKEDAALARANKYAVYITNQVLNPDDVYALEWEDSELGARETVSEGLPPVPEPGSEGGENE